MDEPSPEHPLTRKNLGKLGHQALSISTPSTDLPDDRLARAKQRVYQFLWRLKKIGAEGEQILQQEDLQIVGYEVHYRGARKSTPELDDPTFWTTKLHEYEQKYNPTLRLELVKGQVRAAMLALRSYEEGREALKRDDLHITDTGAGAVRYRGPEDSKPNLEDPAYWNAKLTYFSDLYNRLFQKIRRIPPSISQFLSSDSEAEDLDDDEVLTENHHLNWRSKQEDIQKWALAQSTRKDP
ncbi:hypothetical protein CT0861_01021 [Colletotrichum tofieldiae]|uniref:Uncharacterized protein n=1 Tax=Colletotrichum tofieldiae TaxID=708197 RepID=A0A161VJ35_9PEZI|nr:hypothetical protein CT0861_01021 [Colletotrichum tofieldiae]GKT83836.1 hypothetical protein Ct61P_01686 [Colletotrichum tofieldiae]